MYMEINAWREILARIFEGFVEQDNVSPPWLINPATRRRLKLDKYYPEAGIAIRFIGLTAKGQGRQSDWEAVETENRDETRSELCRQNGVQLVLIHPADDARKQLDQLLQALTRASRVMAQSQSSMQHKQKWMPALHEARGRGAKLHSNLSKNPDQVMATWAERWRDREAGIVNQLQAPLPEPPRRSKRVVHYIVGQRVEHERFGLGTVTQMSDGGNISINFDGSQERTFAVELVQDKLKVMA